MTVQSFIRNFALRNRQGYLLNPLYQNKNMNNKRQSVSMLFMLFGILFCVCLIASNVFATKQIAMGEFSVTGGLLVFPISYIINDCVCEVWGYRKVRLLIWIGFAMNFFFTLVGALCDWIPGAPYWTNDQGFHAIFGLAPRVAAASFAAFIVGSFANAYVMSRMKISSNGHRFSLRAILSTVAGESADSLIFFPLAFWGVIPLSEIPVLMLMQVVLKTAYEIVVLPLTIRVVRWVKAYEGEDVYDEGVDYNVLKIFNF